MLRCFGSIWHQLPSSVANPGFKQGFVAWEMMKIELWSCEGSVPPSKGVSFPISVTPWFSLANPGLLSQMLDLDIPNSGSEIQRCNPSCRRVARTCCLSFLLRSWAGLRAALWAHRVNTCSEPCQRETSPLCSRSSLDFAEECIVGEDKRAAPCQLHKDSSGRHMRCCPWAVWQLGWQKSSWKLTLWNTGEDLGSLEGLLALHFGRRKK